MGNGSSYVRVSALRAGKFCLYSSSILFYVAGYLSDCLNSSIVNLNSVY